LSLEPDSRVLVMVPTLNEQLGLEKVLEEMPNGLAVLVVDGGSTDRTVDVAKQYRAEVIAQKFGKGKGCGVRTGMEYFLGTDRDVLCIIDGDGSNDPRELPKMTEVLENKKADVVLGSRVRGKKERGAMNAVTTLSNLIVSLLLGFRFLRIFTDVQTGYWAFSRKAVETIYHDLKAKGFEIEMEIFMQTFRASLRCMEVPVSYRKRLGETKFRLSLRLRNVFYLVHYLLRSFWPR
jgi:dolichol-phosphate mannosyltransferase